MLDNLSAISALVPVLVGSVGVNANAARANLDTSVELQALLCEALP